VKNRKYNVKLKIIAEFKKMYVICSKQNKITNVNLNNNFKSKKKIINQTCNTQNLKVSTLKIYKIKIKNISNKTNNNNNNHICLYK